jgi:putative endonuclease
MQSFGRQGEDKAAAFLAEKGYEIQERNYRFKKSEVDLICRHKGLLIFVEVKTRSSKAFGYPESFVSENQQEAIIRAAEAYMLDTDWEGGIRFDIIAIYHKGAEEELVHLEDAFY